MAKSTLAARVAAPPTAEPAYDVAISFLVSDEKTASAIKAGLAGLKVFFYPHNQEDLIGTNGIESMRDPFLKSRVDVILFRERYGNTPWTGVELSAIQDSCLKSRYQSLVFVQLDKKDQKPAWLPDTHIRCILGDFTLEQVIGAIKLRVQERDGVIARPNALSEAQRVQRAATLAADRERLFRDRNWIETQVHEPVRIMIAEVLQLVEELKKEGFEIVGGSKDRECVLRYKYVSFAIYWRQPYYNTIDNDDSDLRLAEFSGGVLIPGESGIMWGKPTRLREHALIPALSEAREVVWRENSTKKYLPTSELADHIVRIFVDLMSRTNEGKVQRPNF